MKQRAVAIVGGGWGARVQVPAFRAAGLDVRVLVDITPERARTIADQLGVEEAMADFQALIRREDIDLVVIAAPPEFHRDMAIAALEAGKHVLCEKPMAPTASSAADMVVAAERHSGQIALIDHELRFLPEVHRARHLIQSGAIGVVQHAQAVIANPTRMDPERLNLWWSHVAQGGGVLMGIACHMIDKLRFVIGEVEAVSGTVHTYVNRRQAGPIDSDDFTAFILRLRGDVFAQMMVSGVSRPGTANEFLILGTGGSLRFVDRQLILTTAEGTQDMTPAPTIDIPAQLKNPFEQATVYEAHALAAALNGDREAIGFAAHFADAIQVQRVLDAVRQSHQQGGQWVALLA